MKTLYIFLFCLLTTQAARSWKTKRGYAVREAGHDSGGGGGGDGGGYQYQAPSAGGGESHQSQGGDQQYQSEGQMNYHQQNEGYHYDAPTPSSGAMMAAMMAHQEAMQNFDVASAAIAGNDHSGNTQAPAGFQDLSSFTSHANAVLGASNGNAENHNSAGHAGGDYDYNSVLNSVNTANFGNSLNIGGSGSSDQFTGVQGEVIDERPPSVFKYKPHFGGKDINNLPHILPPGGKSVQELQDEADAKLRSIIEKARINQMEVAERIEKLKTNYGFGTLGYEGFKDTRFKKMGKIDLGSHRAVDLGTSIDYNALKGSNGKLKLPIQNIYHTKTLGIHIPKPYPIKHEVAVPAPYPVPHPIPVPQHKPKLYSPLSNHDVAQLSADDGQGSYGSFPHFEGNSQSNFNFGFDEQAFKGPTATGSTFTIEPSHSVSESSSIGGLPYGAGTPNAAQSIESGNSAQGDFSNQGHGQSLPLSTYGLPPGAVSGGLSSYDVPIHGHQQSHMISSEAGQVQIPAMMHSQPENSGSNQPHAEYGPPQH